MNKGAAAAYEQIDTKVTANLIAARDLLQKIKNDGKLYQQTKTTVIDTRTVNITDYSVDSQPQSTCNRPKSNERIPPVLVRCPENPEDAPVCVRKLQQPHVFPAAQILSRKPLKNSSLEPLECVKNIKQNEPRSDIPDSLFPKAHYKPRCFKKKELKNKPIRCRSPLSPGVDYSTATGTGILTGRSTSRSSESEESSRKSRKSRKSKKSNSYSSCASSQTDNSISMSQLPMTFYSKDGKMKMLLTQTNDGTGVATGMLMARSEAKKDDKKEEIEEIDQQELFPPIPRQLYSSHQLRTVRNKFSAKFNIDGHPIDISGLFKNYDLKKKNIEKLYINGKSYLVN